MEPPRDVQSTRGVAESVARFYLDLQIFTLELKGLKTEAERTHTTSNKLTIDRYPTEIVTWTVRMVARLLEFFDTYTVTDFLRITRPYGCTWLYNFRNYNVCLQEAVKSWEASATDTISALEGYFALLKAADLLFRIKENISKNLQQPPQSVPIISITHYIETTPEPTLEICLEARNLQFNYPPNSINENNVFEDLGTRWFTGREYLFKFTKIIVGRAYTDPFDNIGALRTHARDHNSSLAATIFRLSSQNMWLESQYDLLQEMRLPGTCLAYRTYLEHLAPRLPGESQTKAWKNFWEADFNHAIKSRTSQLWKFIQETFPTDAGDQQFVNALKEEGKNLYSTLSDPAHNFHPTNNTWYELTSTKFSPMQQMLLKYIKTEVHDS